MIALAHYRSLTGGLSMTSGLSIPKSTDVTEADLHDYVIAHWSEYIEAAEAVLEARA